jgi:hypothetical protein
VSLIEELVITGDYRLGSVCEKKLFFRLQESSWQRECSTSQESYLVKTGLPMDTTGKQDTFLGAFIFFGTEEYNCYIFLGYV